MTTEQRAPLDVERLRSTLHERWPRIEVVDEAESTNTTLLADAEAPDRSVLVAEHQIAGRGRLGRSWQSPPRAGLTFSALLRPTAPIAAWGWLPLLAGVAVHDAVHATGVAAALKWPNDLLVGDPPRKAAGLLAQTSGDAVVIGIGLNVSTRADELPVEGATSLALAGFGDVDRTELLIAILQRLDARYAQWSDVGGDADACGLAAAYREVCATLGQLVVVTPAEGEPVRGIAVDIDSIGRLRLEVDGTEQLVGAGDVRHLRPA
jgi:BirA family biotin operon repressor/biotin-[acetyl-CoA-carboxylase] ligase